MNDILLRIKKYNFVVLVSSAAAMFVYLCLSIWIFDVSKSKLLSAATFACAWSLPFVWPRGVSWFVSKFRSSTIAQYCEFVNGVTLFFLVIAIKEGAIFFALPLIAVRGFNDALLRAALTFDLKVSINDSDMQRKTISKFEFYRIVGTTSGGVLISISAQFNIVYSLLIASLLHFLLITVFYKTKSIDNIVATNNLTKTIPLKQLFRTQSYAIKWIAYLSIITLFQGLHNAMRVTFPVDILKVGASGVGHISVISTVGVLVGGWIGSKDIFRNQNKQISGPVFIFAISIFLICASQATSWQIGYALYFLFMVAFEVSFMRCSVDVVTTSSNEHAAAVIALRATALSIAAMSGLVFSSLLLGILNSGKQTIVLASALFCLLSLLVSYFMPYVEE